MIASLQDDKGNYAKGIGKNTPKPASSLPTVQWLLGLSWIVIFLRGNLVHEISSNFETHSTFMLYKVHVVCAGLIS